MVNLLRGLLTVVFTMAVVASCDKKSRSDEMIGDVVRIESGSHMGCFAVITNAYAPPNRPALLTLRTKCSRVNDGVSELIETTEDNVRRVDF